MHIIFKTYTIEDETKRCRDDGYCHCREAKFGFSNAPVSDREVIRYCLANGTAGRDCDLMSVFQTITARWVDTDLQEGLRPDFRRNLDRIGKE